MSCPRNDEAWVLDFAGIDVDDLLTDEEPLGSALRDQRESGAWQSMPSDEFFS